MSIVPKEHLREMIDGANLKSANDLHSFLKDLFKDALQEMLEAELEVELGYSKGDRKNKGTENRRNGYSEKTVKLSMVSWILKYQGIEMVNLNLL